MDAGVDRAALVASSFLLSLLVPKRSALGMFQQVVCPFAPRTPRTGLQQTKKNS